MLSNASPQTHFTEFFSVALSPIFPRCLSHTSTTSGSNSYQSINPKFLDIHSQATRVIFIVSFVPILFISKLGFSEIAGYNYENIYDVRYFLEITFLIVICYLFSKLLKKFNIPSPILVGAMALSGLFYTFEIVNSRFPDTVINLAFIFLGTALGSRLNGLKLKELFFYIFHGIIVCSILVIVAMITAYLLQYLGFDFIPTFLSFAPGGIHEMVVISVAYNIDPIFVSYHHFLRIIIIVAFLPFLLKKFGNNSIKKDWN